MKFRLSEISRLWPIAKRITGEKLVKCVEWLFSSEKFRKDVFGTHRRKRVLLCYLPEAFAKKELPKYHSNLTECYSVAKVFDSLGYSVDCVSRTKRGIDYSPYEVVFGINGNAFFGSFAASNKPLKIFYSVGAHTFYSYMATAERNLDFFRRHGKWLLGSNRYMPGDGRNYYEALFADGLICLGDSFVEEKYISDNVRSEHCRSLSAFYFPVACNPAKKDFGRCRKNILWFGSSGLLHKGLDIAIDFVLENPQYTLHVCGGSSREQGFWNYYSPMIKGRDNIHIHGFVDIESPRFKEILDECGILLNPSVSEGGAVSVLNVLGNAPMFPVYSKGTGLDLDGVGYEVCEVTYDSFRSALLDIEKLPDGTIEERAWAAYNLVKEKYTLEKYCAGMCNHIKDIIEKNR